MADTLTIGANEAGANSETRQQNRLLSRLYGANARYLERLDWK